MKYSGAEITIKLLERQGILEIAGIPGGANLPLYNALYKSNIRHILTRHEQGAGFLAQGMARSTGKAAVAFATSGPGATNIVTAIADAKLDSVPIIIITGQVSGTLIGTDAFQEVDIYGMTVPITKHNFLIRSAEELFEVIPEAFRIAQSGRPGPVHIDIPKDVQNQMVEFEQWPEPGIVEPVMDVDVHDVKKAAEMINQAKRPVFYVGGGIIAAAASEALAKAARKGGIPVTTTLNGLGCFPADDPLNLGMLGMHSARYTNFILDEADLLIALGVRFDDRATGNINQFCKNAQVIHVDIDDAEINKIRQAEHTMTSDVGAMLKELVQWVEPKERKEWHERIAELREKHPFVLPNEADAYHPVNIIRTVASVMKPDDIVATDVGQHQMWVAQAYPFRSPRTLLTSGGLGTMGFGMPTAIGAAVANPDKNVVCFSGDGSILMNIQELAAMADLEANVKVIIFNNGHLGLVRQQQELFYSNNVMASKFEKRTDYVKVAEGFGIKALRLDGQENMSELLKEAIASSGPMLIDIAIDPVENVFPIVPPGAANVNMIGGEVVEG